MTGLYPGTSLTVDQYGPVVADLEATATVRRLLNAQPDGAVLADMLGVTL